MLYLIPKLIHKKLKDLNVNYDAWKWNVVAGVNVYIILTVAGLWMQCDLEDASRLCRATVMLITVSGSV